MLAVSLYIGVLRRFLGLYHLGDLQRGQTAGSRLRLRCGSQNKPHLVHRHALTIMKESSGRYCVASIIEYIIYYIGVIGK